MKLFYGFAIVLLSFLVAGEVRRMSTQRYSCCDGNCVTCVCGENCPCDMPVCVCKDGVCDVKK